MDVGGMEGTTWTVCVCITAQLLSFSIFVPGTRTVIEASTVNLTQRYDGWYNNLAHPQWGTPGGRFIRMIPAAYSDGVYKYAGQERPNARYISQMAMSGPSGLPSYKNRTVFLALFGQFVSMESLMGTGSTCPRELTPIGVPKCDLDYDIDCTGKAKLPFLRATYDKKTGVSTSQPREQTSGTTTWIDGSVIYGSRKLRADMLRKFVDGKLKMREDGKYPQLNELYLPVANPPPGGDHHLRPPERQWLFGDPRLFQHPALLVFGVLFMRWHNHLAEKFAVKYPDRSDEDIFQLARKWNIATLQKIMAYDFYPAFVNEDLPSYGGYKESVYPGVTHMFQVAAFRFGHSMVPPGFYRRYRHYYRRYRRYRH